MTSLRCSILIVLVKCYFIYPCYCNDMSDGIEDSIKGAIQLVTGINQLMSGGKSIGAPLSIATLLKHQLTNQENTTNLLEALYDKYFHKNATVDGNDTMNRTTDSATNTEDNPQPVDNFTTNYDVVTNFPAGVAEPVTSAEGYYFVTEYNVTDPVQITPEDGTITTTPMTLENSTFERFLSLQDNVCLKMKKGIESITHSDLVVLFMKFLEYDYLKAKESWERVKVTTNKILEAVVAAKEDETAAALESPSKFENVLRFLNRTKHQLRSSFDTLRQPFALVMRGIKNRTGFTEETQAGKNRSFCEVITDSERTMGEIIVDLERKFNDKLDFEIKKEKEFLDEGKNNPEVFSLINKETVVNDINFVRDRIYSIYNYLKTTAVEQLRLLQ